MFKSQSDKFKALLLGGGAREHAIAQALCLSGKVELYAIAHNFNLGIDLLANRFEPNHSEKDVDWIADWAESESIDFAVIGLEDPLDVGLTDVLAERGIPTIGPSKAAAKVETSKLFLRELMRRHDLPGQVGYHYFEDAHELEEFLLSSTLDYALKPLGLTAGKGVKVMGVQLTSVEEAIAYGREVIKGEIGGSAGIIAEERVIGEEFTLQAFVDGINIVPMPLVKDFKLAYDGDKGPNTGSMGSYSQADGLLPFVSVAARDYALEVMRQVVVALRKEDIVYRGVMYGQFCMTKNGPKMIEINARFGDPEGINALALLETDFVNICQAITNSTLDQLEVHFAPKATVCKYVTPSGYPTEPLVGSPLTIDTEKVEALGVKVYFAKVDKGAKSGEVLTTASRAIALVGIGQTVSEAEAKVAKALAFVQGQYHVRNDIGKGVREPAATGV